MKLKPIVSDEEYENYLAYVDKLFEKRAHPNTRDGEILHIALMLIKEYEDEHFPIPIPDPIEAIKIKMSERGIRNKDLVGKIGSKGYVSALLSKKKPLTLELAKLFHRELGISAEVFLSS